MKEASVPIVVLIAVLTLASYLCAQMPPKPSDPPQPGNSHVGNVVSLQGSTLTVTGGKGGQTAFNTATATWHGYASPSEVKAGDPVLVRYSGTVDGLKKAVSVTNQTSQGSNGPNTGARTGGTPSTIVR